MRVIKNDALKIPKKQVNMTLNYLNNALQTNPRQPQNSKCPKTSERTRNGLAVFVPTKDLAEI